MVPVFVALVSAAFVVLVSAAFVALIPVAFVMLARKDALDHAIWTVAVVPHSVVTDHHHRHSLELVLVEVVVIEIVVVIVHAIQYMFSSCSFSPTSRRRSWEQSWWQEDQEEHQDHQRR